MDREQTALFIGHRDCAALKPQQLEDAIIKHIEQGVRLFLNGGMGRYDEMCASIVHRLKQRYPGTRSELVIPYLSFNISNPDLYDSILFPEELEGLYYKAAIPARNKYLVQHAGYAICYVEHSWGGAAQTLRMAQKAGMIITNLGDVYAQSL